MADAYDLVVIGGGPGGYNCAIRGAQLGMRVACVEKRDTYGGTCLNVGCIPSKALLHASEVYHETCNGISRLGVKVHGVDLDLPLMMQHKDKSVRALTKGVEYLLNKNKIDAISGAGRIVSPSRVDVTGPDGAVNTLETRNIVIATGSEVMPLPGIDVDEDRIVSSTGALSLRYVPQHLVVVGGGYIGLEMGSVWRRLGAKVTVVEFLDRITPGLDAEIADQFQKVLRKQGFEFKLGTKVTGVDKLSDGVRISTEDAAGGNDGQIEADVVLISIGRRPYTDNLGLEDVGVQMDNRGFILTDHFKTNVDGIYAIGDVTHGPMLAHKAEDEASAVAEVIAGQAGHVNYDVIPSVVYTSPEVAAVGKTEEELKDQGVSYKVGRFPFTANARAKVAGHTEGMVKVIADAATDQVLGVHMIGPNVGEIIAEAAIAMEFCASAEDIAMTCHAHPTLTEAVRQAAMDVHGRTMQM